MAGRRWRRGSDRLRRSVAAMDGRVRAPIREGRVARRRRRRSLPVSDERRSGGRSRACSSGAPRPRLRETDKYQRGGCGGADLARRTGCPAWSGRNRRRFLREADKCPGRGGGDAWSAGRRARSGRVCSPLRLSDKCRGRGSCDAWPAGRRAVSGREQQSFLHESDECRSGADWRDRTRPDGSGLPRNWMVVWTEDAGSATVAEARGQAPLRPFPAPPPLASDLPDARLRSR